MEILDLAIEGESENEKIQEEEMEVMDLTIEEQV